MARDSWGVAGGPRGTARPPLRIMVAGLITMLVLAAVSWNAVFSDDGTTTAAVGDESATVQGGQAQSTTTSVVPIPVDPTWIRKGVSRYSESEKSKQVRDQLEPEVATTAPPTQPPVDTPTSSVGRSTTTPGATRPPTTRGVTSTAPPATPAPTVAPTVPTPTEPPVTDPPAGA